MLYAIYSKQYTIYCIALFNMLSLISNMPYGNGKNKKFDVLNSYRSYDAILPFLDAHASLYLSVPVCLPVPVGLRSTGLLYCHLFYHVPFPWKGRGQPTYCD